MRTTIDNEEVRRTYSICSSPLDNEWRVAIKKVDGGLFSTFANERFKDRRYTGSNAAGWKILY